MSTSTPTSLLRQTGFTLIELVIVIVIVGVIGAIAVPRFAQATARQQLESAAQRIEADLELAKTRARASSQSVSITFNTSRETYRFNGGGGLSDEVDLRSSMYNINITLAKFGINKKVALFNGYGIPSSPGFVQIKSSAGIERIKLLANGEVVR